MQKLPKRQVWTGQFATSQKTCGKTVPPHRGQTSPWSSPHRSKIQFRSCVFRHLLAIGRYADSVDRKWPHERPNLYQYHSCFLDKRQGVIKRIVGAGTGHHATRCKASVIPNWIGIAGPHNESIAQIRRSIWSVTKHITGWDWSNWSTPHNDSTGGHRGDRWRGANNSI